MLLVSFNIINDVFINIYTKQILYPCSLATAKASVVQTGNGSLKENRIDKRREGAEDEREGNITAAGDKTRMGCTGRRLFRSNSKDIGSRLFR